MALHIVPLERRTLHGHFSRDLQPILEIAPGDTVRFSMLDAGWGLEAPHADGTPRRRFAPLDSELDRGHALCGPVAIRGAHPGMALGALCPFMGVMGLPPAEHGVHATSPPRPSGGNIDCKELVAGSTLYLPVTVPGALFSVGDGHALQADGESSGTAIECPMEWVDLTFTLLEEPRIATPRAHTPEGWLTFGFDQSLDRTTYIALGAMLDLLHEQYGLERREALGLASLLVDLRITQIVNGVKGVHAVLPHGALHGSH